MFLLLEQWVISNKKWIRCLSIATIPPYIRARNKEVNNCLNLLNNVMLDEDKDVKKAVGWALRELSKKDPQAVYDYLINWTEKSNKHTKWIIKEGIKKLDKKLKISILSLLT